MHWIRPFVLELPEVNKWSDGPDFSRLLKHWTKYGYILFLITFHTISKLCQNGVVPLGVIEGLGPPQSSLVLDSFHNTTRSICHLSLKWSCGGSLHFGCFILTFIFSFETPLWTNLNSLLQTFALKDKAGHFYWPAVLTVDKLRAHKKNQFSQVQMLLKCLLKGIKCVSFA